MRASQLIERRKKHVCKKITQSKRLLAGIAAAGIAFSGVNAEAEETETVTEQINIGSKVYDGDEENSANLDIKATGEAPAIYIWAKNGVSYTYKLTGSSMKLSSEADQPVIKVEANGSSGPISTLLINPDNKESTVQIKGDISVGASDSGEGSIINANFMNAESYFAGNLKFEGDRAKAIEMKFSNGATYYANEVGDENKIKYNDLSNWSLYNYITMDYSDGGILDAAHKTGSKTEVRDSDAGATLEINPCYPNNYDGGTILLKADSEKTDVLKIAGDTNSYSIDTLKLGVAFDKTLSRSVLKEKLKNGYTNSIIEAIGDDIGINTLKGAKAASVIDDGKTVVIYESEFSATSVTGTTSTKITEHNDKNKLIFIREDSKDTHRTFNSTDSLEADHDTIYTAISNKDSKLLQTDFAIKEDGKQVVKVNNGANWYVGNAFTDENTAKTYDNGTELGITVNAEGGIVDLAHTDAGTMRDSVAGAALSFTNLGNKWESAWKTDSPVIVDDVTASVNGATFILKADATTSDKLNLGGNGSDSKQDIKIGMVFDKNTDSNALKNKLKESGYEGVVNYTEGANGTVTGVEQKSDIDNGLTTVTFKPNFTKDSSGKVSVNTTTAEANATTADFSLEIGEGPAMKAAAAGSQASMGVMSATRSDNNDIMRRMGDLRFAGGEAGTWVRHYAGENEIKGGSTLKYSAIQVGYDKIFETANGKWFAGLTVSRNKGSIGMPNGDGSTGTTMVGVYGSWLGEKGHFADIILKQGRMNADFRTVSGTDSYRGEFDANVTSLSAEYGYRKNLNNGFFLEPNAELSFGRVSGADYTMNANFGASPRIKQDAVTSFIGRAGFNIGQTNENTAWYAKLSLVHEFNGDSTVTGCSGGTSVRHTESGKDTWIEYGLGFTTKVGHSSNLYGELEKSTGSVVKEKWRTNLGFRISF